MLSTKCEIFLVHPIEGAIELTAPKLEISKQLLYFPITVNLLYSLVSRLCHSVDLDPWMLLCIANPIFSGLHLTRAP